MAKTPNFLPYPVGTDLVVDGDNAIGALAGALRLTHGIASVGPPAPAGTVYAEKAIVFPAGLFTAVPTIVLTGVVNTSGTSLIAGVSTSTPPTVNGFTIRIATNAGTTFTQAYNVQWFAIQLPTS